MKKLLYIFLGLSLIFACSDDSSDDNTNPLDDTNPVYLDSNGVTIKAKDWAVVGESGIINGITYSIVNRETLVNMIDNSEDLTSICTSRIVNMNSLFKFQTDFNQPIGSWDVSNVTNMNSLFEYATSFNQNISKWNVGNVTQMSLIFDTAASFNQPLNEWNVENVEDFIRVFRFAESFNQPIGDWNINSNDFYGMFEGAISFNQDLSNLNFSDNTNLGNMFKNAESFNKNLSDWDVSEVTFCLDFCLGASSWTLPKPNFTNCESGCD